MDETCSTEYTPSGGSSLALGSVPVGAFNDDQVRKVLNLPANHEPLYLIPLGHINK